MSESRLDAHELVKSPMRWNRSGSVRFPWVTRIEGHLLQLYDGDWPTESAYTLYIDGEPVGHFDGWPAPWIKVWDQPAPGA